VRALLEDALLRQEGEVRDYDVEHLFERIGWRSMRLNADVMPRLDRADLILGRHQPRDQIRLWPRS
jgi:hypothetical protein